MNKIIASVFVLAVSIVLAIILFGVVRNAYPDFASFYSLLGLGLVAFGFGVLVFISGLLMAKGIQESNSK